MAPTVSFIVPCFKLAHFLKECVDSILAQTFDDFDVLIMDDCSPDDTPAVARSFHDRRVRHVRHDANLGHLRNYNRGVELAAGEYVWLISADDSLRSPHVLKRFVSLLASNAAVGYVFCPSVRSNDPGQVAHNAHGREDRIIPGHRFVRTMLHGNGVSAPAALARKACYERIGGFPLDLPFTADWYVWTMFALDWDVGYVAEPMVTYRIHQSNMTRTFLGDPPAMTRDEIEVRWRIRRAAEARQVQRLASLALRSIAADYAVRVARFTASGWNYGFQLADVERSLGEAKARPRERSRVLSAVHMQLGDDCYARSERQTAIDSYRLASRERPWSPTARLKTWLLRLGRPGDGLRRALSRLRRVGRSTERNELPGFAVFEAPPDPATISPPAARRSPVR